MFPTPQTTLQVMIERDPESTITVEDCARVSRALDAVFNSIDGIPESCQLEVSSPGLERPLVKPEDFTRFAGARVRAVVDPPLDGRRRFNGRLNGMVDGDIQLEQDSGDIVSVPFDRLVEANLVYSG